MVASMATALEVAALSVSGAVMLGYNALALLARGTNLATMLRADSVWSRRYASPKHGGSAQDIVAAVQTLRNSVLVSVFIGTVAFNTMTSALGSLRDGGATASSFAYLVELLVALLAAGSFLSFAVCIRCAAHSGYVVGGATFLEMAVAAPAAVLAAPVAATPAVAAAGAAPAALRAAAATPLSGADAVSVAIDAAAAGASAPADAPACSDAVGDDAAAERERLRVHLLHLVRTQSVFFSVAFRLLYSLLPFLFGAAGPVALLAITAVMVAFLVVVDFAHHVDSSKCVGALL